MIALIEYNAIPIAISALLGVASAWWAFGGRARRNGSKGDEE